MLAVEPNRRYAHAWPSSWRSTEANTTTTHSASRLGSEAKSQPVARVVRKKSGWTRTGNPSTWKWGLMGLDANGRPAWTRGEGPGPHRTGCEVSGEPTRAPDLKGRPRAGTRRDVVWGQGLAK